MFGVEGPSEIDISATLEEANDKWSMDDTTYDEQGLKYLDGVRYALAWVLGDNDEDPLEIGL